MILNFETLIYFFIGDISFKIIIASAKLHDMQSIRHCIKCMVMLLISLYQLFKAYLKPGFWLSTFSKLFFKITKIESVSSEKK